MAADPKDIGNNVHQCITIRQCAPAHNAFYYYLLLLTIHHHGCAAQRRPGTAGHIMWGRTGPYDCNRVYTSDNYFTNRQVTSVFNVLCRCRRRFHRIIR